MPGHTPSFSLAACGRLRLLGRLSKFMNCTAHLFRVVRSRVSVRNRVSAVQFIDLQNVQCNL